MFLSKKDLLELQNEKTIIENVEPECFTEIGYDLRINKIYAPSKKISKETYVYDSYELAPGKTVFIGTVENLNMPLDMIGVITQRNSRIRLGLHVDGPVYHPGHHTKIFLRVTNISDVSIKLSENDSIASVMFEKLSSEAEKYEGSFKYEFDYTALENYKDLPRTADIEEKMQSLEHIEKSLYEKVIAILTVFVGLFSLINLNINFLSVAKGLHQMLAYNLISIGGIGMLISFVGILINNNKRYKPVLYIFVVSLLFIAASVFILLKFSAQ